MRQELLLRLYKKTLRLRLIELEISKKYSEWKMRCPTHLSIGQEAVAASFSEVVKKRDYAVSSHRAHAHYLATGGDFKKMIAEIYGKKTGCSKGRGGSMHLIDLKVNFMGSSAIVANSIPVGTGLALASKLKQSKQISYIFFGDGAVEQGAFYESINFAAVKNLPVIFVCENNLYSVYSSLNERQPYKRKNYKMAESIGIKSFSCDGNDVISCYNNFKKAEKFVRSNKKPIFLEFSTYRIHEHCGPNIDDYLKYRPKKEINFWKKRDPVLMLENKVKKINKKILNKIYQDIDKEIKSAFSFAEKSPWPKNKSAFEDVYG